MIDTHSHLYVPEFDTDSESVIKSLLAAGVTKVILPNIDEESISQMHRLSDKHPTIFFPAMGLHPSSVFPGFEFILDKMEAMHKKNKYVAVGEIGIDLYWDKTYLKEQQIAFEQQVLFAKKMKLPIIIHVRESFNEVFEIIDKHIDENLFGVFHCFTGNDDQAKHVMNYKTFKMGIGGVVTYKTSTLPEVLKNVPLQFILLETDSPYLPPVPFRGKRNESAYVMYIAKKLSEIYNVSLPEIESVTDANAKQLFGF